MSENNANNDKQNVWRCSTCHFLASSSRSLMQHYRHSIICVSSEEQLNTYFDNICSRKYDNETEEASHKKSKLDNNKDEYTFRQNHEQNQVLQSYNNNNSLHNQNEKQNNYQLINNLKSEQLDFTNEATNNHGLMQIHNHCITSDRENNNNENNDKNAYDCSYNLIKILKQYNCSNKMYKSIIDWAQHSTTTLNINFSEQKLPSRELAIKKMRENSNINDISPKREHVFLPGLNEFVTISVSNSLKCIESLLADSSLMKSENLLFEKNDKSEIDPYKCSHNQHDDYKDLNTGSVFVETHKQFCTNPTDVLLPLIFFIDKTTVAFSGNLSFEGVYMTLGIFNYKTRRKLHAWRCIGSVNTMINTSKYKQVTAKSSSPKYITNKKHNDYHIMLSKIFEQIISIQKSTGIETTLKLKAEDISFPAILKVFTLLIIGDTEGHCKLCGIISSPGFASIDNKNDDVEVKNIKLLAINDNTSVSKSLKGDNEDIVCTINEFDENSKLDKNNKEIDKTFITEEKILLDNESNICNVDLQLQYNKAQTQETTVTEFEFEEFIPYNPKTCRYCECPFSELDDETKQHERRYASKVYNIILDIKKNPNAEKQLNKLGVRPLETCFLCDMNFGANPYGIFGAVPMEPLHFSKLGIITYTLDQLLEAKQCKSKNRIDIDVQEELMLMTTDIWKKSFTKISNMQGQNLKETYCKLYSQQATEMKKTDISNHNKYGVFQHAPKKSEIAGCADLIGRYLAQTCENNFPSTTFSSTIFNTTNITANERPGIAHILLILLQWKPISNYIWTVMGKDYALVYFNILEEIILLDHYLTAKEYTAQHILLATKYMKTLMQKLKRVLQRTKGTGFKFTKFHSLKHLFSFVEMFGIFATYDTGPLEALHKPWTKITSKRTQHQHATYNHQVNEVATMNLMIDDYFRLINEKQIDDNKIEVIVSNQEDVDENKEIDLLQIQLSQNSQETEVTTTTHSSTKSGVMTFGNFVLKMKRFEMTKKDGEYNILFTKLFSMRHNLTTNSDLNRYFPQKILRNAILDLFKNEVDKYMSNMFDDITIPLYTFCKIEELMLHGDPMQVNKIKNDSSSKTWDIDYKRFAEWEPAYKWSFVYYEPSNNHSNDIVDNMVIGKILFFTHLNQLRECDNEMIVKGFNINTKSKFFAIIQPQEMETDFNCKDFGSNQHLNIQTLLCKHITMQVHTRSKHDSSPQPTLLLVPVENIKQPAISVPNNTKGTQFIVYKPVSSWQMIFESLIKQNDPN